MNALVEAVRALQDAPMPDVVTRSAIDFMVEQTRRRTGAPAANANAAFAGLMNAYAIAESTEAANAQHYEVPPELFVRTLGPRLKYSCCFYEKPRSTLGEAELAALERTMAFARLADGQNILELGCGWGSLTLAAAERFPNSTIVAVSNSTAQRQFIERAAQARHLSNVTVVTADMNAFAPNGVFDRIVSVEMFEHMSNWRALLARVRGWLAPHGRLYLHVFASRGAPFRFDARVSGDFIARYFFTGGIMPNVDLIREFADLFELEDQDWWNGRHYERTALDWLANFDAQAETLTPVLNATYGPEARLWRRRWRRFFLITAALFAHADGEVWGVSHYLLRGARRP